MITYLYGEVVSVTEKQLILDVNHVGFRIGISLRDAQAMPPVGQMVKIYTYLSVREDAMLLYGFLSQEDLDIYRKLITVSGIGPKGGLSILSAMSSNDLALAVLSEDAKAISKAPGIGLKTAQKLILELKGKLDLKESLGSFAPAPVPASDNPTFEANKAEAVTLMTVLGYSTQEALKAVHKAELSEDMSADEILRAALKDTK